MMSQSRCMLPVLAALVVASCADEPTAPTLQLTTQETTDSTVGRQMVDHRTMDTEFERIAREDVPGFGGMFFDEQLNPVVYLTDVSRRDAAQQFVDQVQSQLGAPTRTMVVRQAQYDFAELKGWHDQLLPLLWQADGLVWLDIDDTRNRLRVAVENATFIESVRTDIVAAGVPPNAVSVEVHEAPVPRIDLQDLVRPVDAGFRFSVDPEGADPPGYCALGVNAKHEGVHVFISASHCSVDDFSYPDYGTVYQPTIAPVNAFAVEVLDTEIYLCAYGVGYCRWSDAAAFGYLFGVEVEIGFIARTEASAENANGTREVDAGNPRFEIVSTLATEYVGWPINKVGPRSGWTTGTISQACVNSLLARGSRPLQCQTVADLFSRAGDSGSPVFSQTLARPAPIPSEVALHGIMWGGPPGDAQTTWYAPMSGVEADLGTFYVCTRGGNLGCLPGLFTSIDGPDYVSPMISCTWFASPTGGVPPYTHQWSGVLSGSGSSINGSVAVPGGWLYLTTTDAEQQVKNAQINVTSDWGAPPVCF